jgi:SagB-type dehydrogenase family enzyme
VNESQTRLQRGFLKDSVRLAFDFSRTDQSRGVPPPPLEKPYAATASRVDLVPKDQWKAIRDTGLLAAIGNRVSHRQFRDEPLTLEETSFLLWATQGIRRRLGPGAALRTVPSAGCRHAFETYLCALNVTGLDVGVYRYLPVEHQLVLESAEERLPERLVEATLGQSFTGSASATFVWTTIPYRMEWRYGPAAHRVIAMDAGHVCQNLYLAVEAVGAGTCAVAAYHQELMDQLLCVDGDDEFVIYLAPVGKV